MKIRTKLLVYILSVSIFIYLTAIGFVSINLSKIAYKGAKRYAESEAQKYANLIKADLDAQLSVTRGVAKVFEENWMLPSRLWLPMFLEAQKQILKSNPNFLAFATSFEYSAIDSSYKKDYGRLQYGYYRVGKSFRSLHKNKDMERDDKSSLYYLAKSKHIELLTNPYRDSYTGMPEDSVFMASIAVPLLNPAGKFVGLAGVDISMERFQEINEKVKPFPESFSFMLSNNGTIVAHPDQTKITTSIVTEYPVLEEKLQLLDKIKSGVKFSTDYKDVNGVSYFISFVPIHLDKINTPWAIGIAVPLNIIYSQVQRNLIISIFIGVLGMLIIVFIVWYTARQISTPLENATGVLYSLSEGDILKVKMLEVKGKDEIAQIGISINKLVSGLRKMAKFADEIGKGNFDAQLEKLSEKDVIGEVLINMSKNLSYSLNEEQKRQKIEREESWISHGIAQISQILREHYDNFEAFSDDLLSEIIKYTESKIGSVYIFFEDKSNNGLLVQTAVFGADETLAGRREFKPRQSEIGRAYESRKTVVLGNLPKDFFKIKSGLGEHVPAYIYAVPFVFNEECYGVIELGEMAKLEAYKIQFLERVSESIAVTISRLKFNFQTTKLLEESTKAAAILQAKEDVLNTQLSELKSIQRNMQIKAKEAGNLLDAIYSVAFVATYDMKGILIDANDALLNLLNVDKKDIIGRYQGAFKTERSVEKDIEFQNFWNDLRAGNTKKLIQEVEIGGKKVLLSESYTPIFDDKGEPIKVLNLIMDITNTKRKDYRF